MSQQIVCQPDIPTIAVCRSLDGCEAELPHLDGCFAAELKCAVQYAGVGAAPYPSGLAALLSRICK
ncbi:hypothetical protein [Burkholderia sp. Cy-637]|uniref:hypothetical protein n=1 Tax=Burkholderia sp. Cy-637 TaxID=2608327 RepID=UPI001420BA89|nr:hypothetical protein [Burkholderia sp. Cy-637]NIF90650.1 hypothetical protein [Burkholderia sp. Cy-637]